MIYNNPNPEQQHYNQKVAVVTGSSSGIGYEADIHDYMFRDSIWTIDS